jgi:hypothetical protein
MLYYLGMVIFLKLFAIFIVIINIRHVFTLVHLFDRFFDYKYLQNNKPNYKLKIKFLSKQNKYY